ncbi:MAG TPA: hypothetical protein VGM17_12235 [Rhizomicrobium sp.]|jgi:hypothetical protein
MYPRVCVAVAVLVSVSLIGCGSERKLAECPSVSVLVDTGSLPVMRVPDSGNPADLVYTAQIIDAKRDCDMPKYSKHVDASVNIHFRAERSKPGEAASYKVPYFVAITTEGKVLAKQQFWVQFAFDQGATTADFTDSVNSLSLTVARDKRAAEYGIIVGFQLTKSQLAFNRKVGRYAP